MYTSMFEYNLTAYVDGNGVSLCFDFINFLQ